MKPTGWLRASPRNKAMRNHLSPTHPKNAPCIELLHDLTENPLWSFRLLLQVIFHEERIEKHFSHVVVNGPTVWLDLIIQPFLIWSLNESPWSLSESHGHKSKSSSSMGVFATFCWKTVKNIAKYDHKITMHMLVNVSWLPSPQIQSCECGGSVAVVMLRTGCNFGWCLNYWL